MPQEAAQKKAKKKRKKKKKARCACIGFAWTYIFISLGYVPSGGIAGSYVNSAFNHLKKITLTSW